MSSKDKGSIVVVISIGLAILGSILIPRNTVNIPWVIVVAILLLVQYVFILPNLCENWYKVNQAKAEFWRYIPLINEIQMFDRTPALLASILTGLCCFVLVLLLIPTSVLSAVFGDTMAMGWGFNVIAIFIVLAVITNFVYAFGLCGVLRSANMICYEQLNSEPTKTEFIYYLMLMLPFIRICGLLNIRDKINLLVSANVGYKDESKFVRVED